MRNITRQNNSETSGFDRGRCVLTSSCRNTAYPAEEDTPFHQQRDFIDNLSGTLPGNGDDCDKSGIFCRIGSLCHGVPAGRDR